MYTTLVSAFVCVNVDTRGDMSVQDYYNAGKQMLRARCPKIIFLDSRMSSLVSREDYDSENTDIVCIEYINFLEQHRDKITQFKLITNNSGKDTLEYILLMCHKTEFLKRAIERNTFKTLNFVWVDFGIYKIVDSSKHLEYQSHLERMSKWNGERIRIASIWDIPSHHVVDREDIYHRIKWYFAGGVVGGPIQLLLLFSDIVKDFCLKIIYSKGSIMWEVNIWYLVYKDYSIFFDVYKCNHDITILANF